MSIPYVPRACNTAITRFIRAHPRCAVFASMGTGKTVSTFTALRDLHSLGELVGPVLVVAPLRVARTVWSDEVAKWNHLRDVMVLPILGTTAQREEVLRRYLPIVLKPRSPGISTFLKQESRLQVFTVNYENLGWLVQHLEYRWPFKTIVADESTKLKGFRIRQGTTRARALAKVSWTGVERFIALTGTPSPNGLQDLWGQMWFIDKGERLGRTYSAFEARWFQKGFDGFSIKPLPGAQAEIENRLKDVCLSLDAKDYFDVREPIVNQIYVDLPTKMMTRYKELEKQMYTEIENTLGEKHEIEAFSAAAMTTKCLQMVSGALYINGDNKEWVDTHDVKIEALREVVEESGGIPILVAYHFRSDLARLRRAFPMGRVLDKDPQTLNDWNVGRIPLLFAHPASAGHGLNLQYGGNILVFFSRWWNMEEHMQIIERIGPIRQMQAGLERPVFIHHIIARGTIDEVVTKRLETKREVQDLLLEALKQKST